MKNTNNIDKKDLIKELQRINRKQLTQSKSNLKGLFKIQKSMNDILDLLIEKNEIEIVDLQERIDMLK